MDQSTTSETGCCKKFNPEPYQDMEVAWNEKLFLKDHVLSLFHFPLNMGSVVTKNMQKIEKAGSLSQEQLMLSDENSLFGSDVYIAINKEVPEAQNVKISGNFLTKVFEGPFQNIGAWLKEMQGFVAKKGKTAKKYYFCYTTCPKCAKEYGKNYVVIFAQV